MPRVCSCRCCLAKQRMTTAADLGNKTPLLAVPAVKFAYEAVCADATPFSSANRESLCSACVQPFSPSFTLDSHNTANAMPSVEAWHLQIFNSSCCVQKLIVSPHMDCFTCIGNLHQYSRNWHCFERGLVQSCSASPHDTHCAVTTRLCSDS